MAAEAEGLQIRPLDKQRQLQNRLDTNRPSHGGTWLMVCPEGITEQCHIVALQND
jgi:hypothetical protein